MGRQTPPCSPGLSTKITALSKSSGRAGVSFLHSMNSLAKLIRRPSAAKKTPELGPAKAKGPRHHLLTLSIKVTISKHKKRRDGDDDEGQIDRGDGGLWQKGILLGDKCEPPDFSGVIYYDLNGNQLPEFPTRRTLDQSPAVSRQRLPLAAASFSHRQPLEKIAEQSTSEFEKKKGRKYEVKLRKLTSSVRGVLDKLPHLGHRKGKKAPHPGDNSTDHNNHQALPSICSSEDHLPDNRDVVSLTPEEMCLVRAKHEPEEYSSGTLAEHDVHENVGTEENGQEAVFKEGKNSWLLVKDEPGGPTDVTVIPSFGGHVARDVWVGIERGPLRYRNQSAALQNLKSWRWNSPQAKAMAAKSGLTHLSSIMHQEIDCNLVSAFVERWQPDTNTFHMPFGEMTILLHDVHEILGIPVDGVAGHGETPEECCAAEILGVTVGDLKKDRLKYGQGGVLNSYLYSSATEALDHERHAQGMLAYLLGNTLFPDKSGRVKSCIFPLLEDIDKVSDIAWGAATLANLYRELGMASRAESRNISGCLTLLQAWIYEYFPSLAPPPISTPPGCPRAGRWEPCYIAPSDEILLQYYRENLDKMRPEHVNWMPFGGGMDEEVPTTLYAGLVRFGSVMEPYYPTRALRQLGYRQHIPIQKQTDPVEVTRDRVVSKYVLQYDRSAADWSWNSGITIPRSVKLQPIVPGYECSEDYYPWFRRVSHPRIGNPGQASSSHSATDSFEDMDMLRSALTLSTTYEIGPSTDESDGYSSAVDIEAWQNNVSASSEVERRVLFDHVRALCLVKL